MFSFRSLLVICTTVSCCTSCLLTLHPVFTPGDILYDSELPGTYESLKTGKGNTLVVRNLSAARLKLPPNVEAISDRGYLFQYKTNKLGIAEYAAFIVQLGGERYLDLFPVGRSAPGDDFYSALLIPMHSIYKIQRKDSLLDLLPMDQDFVHRQIRDKQTDLKYEMSSAYDDLEVSIITAGTTELQAFITRHGQNPDAFDLKEREIYQKLVP